MIFLVQPVHSSFVPVHSFLFARDPVLNHREVEVVFDCEKLIILALPDYVKVEKGLKDGRIHDFVPRIIVV